VIHRRRWLGRRFPPKSPELLAALTALSTQGPNDSDAADALQRAAQHSDPEIRAAAKPPTS
jgi:hypothetical protein